MVDITVPMARPRRSGGTTSAMMAMMTAPISPAHAPASERATSIDT